MTTDVLTKNLKSFSIKTAAMAAITRQGCTETHVPWLTKNGGWIGIPADDPRLGQDNTVREAKVSKKKYKCRVWRVNCDEENKDLTIKVTANGPHERAVFRPGEEKGLTVTQINILKDSILDSKIEIPGNSGIYSAQQPEVAAKNMYPDFQVMRDQRTGLITVYKHSPKYVIDYLGDRPPAA